MTTYMGSRDALSRGALLLACAGLAVLAGCAGFGDMRDSAGAMSYAPSVVDRGVAREAARAPAAPARAPVTTATEKRATAAADISLAAEGQPAPQDSPAQGRLRIYSGFLELVVGEVEKARKRIIDTAGQAGGYVESTSGEYVVVRVPAERFDEVMDSFSALGEVRSRSVESTDVTESYADLGRRIDLAVLTRQRLYDLLEKSTDVDERVSILREIRRLTEEIEQLNAARAVMEGQIRLSRITVSLISRIDEDSRSVAGIPFPWIAGLSPLYGTSGLAKTAFDVAVPAAYAVFESGRRVRLEAADGTRLRIGALPNEPRGDTAFWRDALVFHLKGLYRSSDGVTAGAFAGAAFESKDIEPFHYLVAVAARGEEILLAEAFLPNAASRERRLAGIRAVLEGVKP